MMRDRKGRFAKDRDVVFGPWDDRIWIFGRKVMPAPVMRESFCSGMKRAADAQTRAAVGEVLWNKDSY